MNDGAMALRAGGIRSRRLSTGPLWGPRVGARASSEVVAVAGPAGFSYADAMRNMKAKISLQELDLDNSIQYQDQVRHVGLAAGPCRRPEKPGEG